MSDGTETCDHAQYREGDGYVGGETYRPCDICGGAVGADGYWYVEAEQAPREVAGTETRGCIGCGRDPCPEPCESCGGCLSLAGETGCMDRSAHHPGAA